MVEKASLRSTYVPGAWSLGLRVRRTDKLIVKVRAGLPFKHLQSLEKQSGLKRELMAQFVATAVRTLARRQAEGVLSPDESDRLLRASRTFELAVDLFEGDVDQARNWLLTPNQALAGECPLAYCSTELGAREVENLMGRLEHGVFS